MFYRADWNTDIEGDKQHYKVMALFNGKNWEHESTENPQKNEAVKGASSGEWGNWTPEHKQPLLPWNFQV